MLFRFSDFLCYSSSLSCVNDRTLPARGLVALASLGRWTFIVSRLSLPDPRRFPTSVFVSLFEALRLATSWRAAELLFGRREIGCWD